MEHAGAPKGSLSFHCPQRKEALGQKAIELAAARFGSLVAASAMDPATAGQVLGRVIDELAGMLDDSDFQLGCPVSVVTLEMGGESERLRDACTEAFESWIAPVSELLVAQGRPRTVARSLATAVVSMYDCAGAFRFGMSVDEARHANVDSVRAVIEFATRLPNLRRLVQVSGYRVGGQGPAPWSDEHRRETYRALGAYEASRVEADAVFQNLAAQLGVPWSIVNPAGVIGDSATGESDQYLGLASHMKDLWQGSPPALPGNGKTFVPVVAADHLARFMTLLPTDAATEHTTYWLLDDDTPALPDLLTLVAEHDGVRAPRTRIPVSLPKRLPRRLTRADPETLTLPPEQVIADALDQLRYGRITTGVGALRTPGSITGAVVPAQPGSQCLLGAAERHSDLLVGVLPRSQAGGIRAVGLDDRVQRTHDPQRGQRIGVLGLVEAFTDPGDEPGDVLGQLDRGSVDLPGVRLPVPLRSGGVVQVRLTAGYPLPVDRIGRLPVPAAGADGAHPVRERAAVRAVVAPPVGEAGDVP
ncbi:SDR family oxidoreductase [Streptomyces vietnamensis]|uniref:LmrA/YxaF family transcription factor n=1 Tax=Streptomyces vietnamensis TaxID=362257 RepID=UPI000AF07C51|nr:SDR family oxidoreductase [Streptomyces vietnamensis]